MSYKSGQKFEKSKVDLSAENLIFTIQIYILPSSTLKIQTITKNCKKPNETLILSTFYHQTLNPQYITVCVKVVLVITQPLY